MPTPTTILVPSQLPPEREILWADCSAGVNFDHNKIDMSPKWVNDCLNVDWCIGGGWKRRDAVRAFNQDTLLSAPVSLGRYTKEDGTFYLMLALADGTVRSLTGRDTASALVGSLGGTTGLTNRFMEVSYKLYVQNGVDACRQWDGTTVTTMASAGWSDDYLSPVTGTVPIAKFMFAWHGRVWALNTYEGGVRKSTRVRSSHPLKNGTGHTSFKESEYNDLEYGVDGEEITGGAIAGGRFFIFKNHHVFEVTGYDWDITKNALFTFAPLDGIAGAVSQESITTHGREVYFWDAMLGAQRIINDPNALGTVLKVDDIMLPLRPLLENGSIPKNRIGEVTAGRVGNRIWFSVPWTGGTSRVLVFDTVQSNWTIYGLTLGPFGMVRQEGQDWGYVAFAKGSGRLVELEIGPIEVDWFGVGNVPIQSFVEGPWIHGDQPQLNNLWECLAVMAATEGNLRHEVHLNWDHDNIAGATISAIGSSGRDSGSRTCFVPAGKPEARAISLRVEAVDPFGYYRVYGYVFKAIASGRQ